MKTLVILITLLKRLISVVRNTTIFITSSFKLRLLEQFPVWCDSLFYDVLHVPRLWQNK
jgi:hypothetical protein